MGHVYWRGIRDVYLLGLYKISEIINRPISVVVSGAQGDF